MGRNLRFVALFSTQSSGKQQEKRDRHFTNSVSPRSKGAKNKKERESERKREKECENMCVRESESQRAREGEAVCTICAVINL